MALENCSFTNQILLIFEDSLRKVPGISPCKSSGVIKQSIADLPVQFTGVVAS